MSFRRAIVLCIVVALGGCSTLSAIGGATATSDVYELRAVDLPQAGRQSGTHVIVETPTTTGALNTDSIMIRPNALQAQYLPGARWSDPAPVMLQTLMLRSLESTNAFSYVGRRPIGPTGDVAVLTELVDFHAEPDAENDTATVRLRITVRLLREGDADIIATRSFESSAIAPSTETRHIVAAFDAAAKGLLRAFTAWTISSLKVR